LQKALSLTSIRGRLAAVLAAAFLPAGVIAAQSGYTAVMAHGLAAQQERAAAELLRLAPAREQVAQLREAARAVAAHSAGIGLDQGACTAALTAMGKEFLDIAVVSILDRDARVRCANMANAYGRATAAGPLIERAAKADYAVLGLVDQPHLTQGPAIGAAMRIQSEAGAEALFAGLSLPLQNVLDAARAPDPEGGVTTSLVAAEGFIVAGDMGSGGKTLHFVRIPPSALVGRARLVDERWAIAASLIEDELYLVRTWRALWLSPGVLLALAWALAAPLLLWGAAVAAAWRLVEVYCARPLVALERVARAYANGEEAYTDERILDAAPEEMTSLRSTLAGMFRALREREARLGEALLEERALLREVNHRVKNNLQMVASILSIQARSAEEPAEARGLLRAQERVQLLALAHSRIYASGEVRSVALDQLTSDVVRTLTASRKEAAAAAPATLALASIRALADHAVPFAFLVGESVAEALDALAGSECPLSIDLRREGRAGVVFEIAGPREAPEHGHRGAAPRLMEAFARQIGAAVEHAPEPGVWTRIRMNGLALAPGERAPPEPETTASG
jgi:two-component sensor histidine kinase